MQTMLFIYNRHAGKDRNWVGLCDIIQTLTEKGYLVTSYPTQGPGDAGEAITKWGSSYDRVVVAGGDGTLNEAISGLLRLPNAPPLGYIAVGSTNDFSKNLSLPATLPEMAATAATGVPRTCDVGRFNGRPFVYVAAFGAFADVSFRTPQRTKNLLGYTAYLLESVKRLGSIKPYQITAEFDGQTVSGKYIYGMVSNTTSVAGFQHFPPGNPDLDDGLLEVTLISPPKDILELEQFGRALLIGNGEIKSPMLHTYSTAKVKICCEGDLLWTIDGENGGTHSIAEVEAQPKAFTIIYGES
jgi:YegS/Rv2252/BmrU family lipid kinase